MVTSPLVSARGIGKQYRIGGRIEHDTLRDHLATAGRRVGRALRGRSAPTEGPEVFWAVRDISFDVGEGEVVGIIGRNGAGKSTLLKILSQITEPTEGEIRLRARVASLLEVGTGFHPELTGRENVYLNGAILGMTRAEIARNFDAIVAFAEVERFLDTPVKRYSSGMTVRLAFAVAAHLRPEVLVIDEVLSVGDAAFQSKCLDKMHEVAESGRTILFVSHNMGTIASLTHRCLYLQQGRVLAEGPSRDIVELYLEKSLEKKLPQAHDLDYYRRDRNVETPVRITGLRVRGVTHGDTSLPVVPVGVPITCDVRLTVTRRISGALLTLVLKTARGERVTVLASWDRDFALFLDPGEHTISVTLKSVPLAPGQYFANVGVNQSTQTRAHDVLMDVPIVEVVNNGQVTQWLDRPWGLLHPTDVEWSLGDHPW